MKLINETDVNFQLKHNNAGAYTLVEVLAASVILLMGVSAVLCLSSGTISQEEATRKVARGYCIQENAAQLYYLGLSPDEILKLLPIGVSEMEVNISDPKAVKINDIFMEVATVNVQLKSGTNDKAGSYLNLLRWVSPRLIKEVFVPPKDFKYPFMG